MRRRLKAQGISDLEISFLRELARRNTRFLLVGNSAALFQGADVTTQDIDLWFASTSDGRLGEASRAVGGFFAWRANPPVISGRGLSRLDVVNRMDGMLSFDQEYANALTMQLEDFDVKVLPLDRIIDSKKAAGRPKDRASLPALYATLEATSRLKKR